QLVWQEVYPYADGKVLRAAAKLELPDNPKQLSELVAREDFARLAAALIRVDLNRAYEKLRQEAHG
ncbi:MAG TPA: hypothetical protein VFL97_10820, partial [Nitrococcus sp.]|nr:hypothetical protein [Nitrococcus sp.]